MKYLLFSIVFVLCTCACFPQGDNQSESIKIELPTNFKKALLVNEIEIPIQSKADNNSNDFVDIKAEY